MFHVSIFFLKCISFNFDERWVHSIPNDALKPPECSGFEARILFPQPPDLEEVDAVAT